MAHFIFVAEFFLFICAADLIRAVIQKDLH